MSVMRPRTNPPAALRCPSSLSGRLTPFAHNSDPQECFSATIPAIGVAANQVGNNYLVSITMTGPQAVRRMLPIAYGTVYPSAGSLLPASS